MLVHFMESQKIHLGHGQTMIKLSIKEHQAINVYIGYLQKAMDQIQNQDVNKNKVLYTVEYHLENKKMILKDNVYILVVNIQIIELLKTLDQDSITKDEDFIKYWSCLINGSLTKLLSLQRTDLSDSDLNLSSGYSYKTIQKSWFSITQKSHNLKNLQKTFLPFYKYLLAGGTEKEDIKPQLRTRKVRLILTSIQKQFLKKWNDDARYSYNKAINMMSNEYIKRDPIPFLPKGCNLSPEWIKRNVKLSSSNTYTSEISLRNDIVPKERCSHISWILKTPKHIRETAVFEAFRSKKAAVTNIRNGNIKHFSMGYRSKKETWSIEIPSDSINVYNNTIGLYEDRITFARIKTTEKVRDIKHNCKVYYDGMHYYLCIPEEKEIQTASNTSNWYCSIDPGSRKFSTLYSPESDKYTIIGDRASTKLYTLLIRLDNLISKGKNKRMIKKTRIRIQNLQKELHSKTAHYLCENFKNVYIPKLTKKNDIINTEKRKINTKTVRNMIVLGHCKFVERLKTKANLYTNVKVHIISEEYTSQICLNCSRLTKTTNELYICKYCSFTLDRDVLGSTNILLKNW